MSKAARCNIAQSKDASLPSKFSADVARAISAQCVGIGLYSSVHVHFRVQSNDFVLLILKDSILALQQYLFQICKLWNVDHRGAVQLPRRTREDDSGATRQGSEWARRPSILCPSCYDISVKVVDTQVIISDFDESFLQNQERTGLRTPIVLLPPEVFLSTLSGLLHSLRDSGWMSAWRFQARWRPCHCRDDQYPGISVRSLV